MIRRLLLWATATVMVAGVAHAAEIKLEGKNADGVPVVSVKGDFIERDIERFADVTKDLDDAIISFSSNGGNLITGIEIGTRIRLRGYRTVVADREECYSACALAWLGGITRYVGRGAQIGFHAAYLSEGGRRLETGVGNALVGSYATNLGFRTPAIIFLTSAPPEGFNLLTEDRARRVQIAAVFDTTRSLIEPKRLLTDELRRAAEKGDAKAQFTLGVMYAEGRGVSRNSTEAARWYRKAAEQGHVPAQFAVGSHYHRTFSSRAFFKLSEAAAAQYQSEAVRWLSLAADQGHVTAMHFVGIFYLNGQGVSRDNVLGLMWLNLAVEQGNTNAKADRDYLSRGFSESVIAEAQRLAREWKPSSR